MTLIPFDIRGEQINDDKTGEMIREGDRRRSLIRYRPDGSENFVHVRVNIPLLRAAIPLPILLIKPVSRADELMPADGLLTPAGSVRNYELLERICDDVVAASVPARYLAEQHGENRRDFFFVTEDAAGFERIAHAAAEAFAFPLTIEHHRLTDLAPVILPAEAIGELGLEVAPDASIRPTRFEFWGAESSLDKLRTALEQRGYRFVSFEMNARELRMLKPVPIDGPGFQAVLKDIVRLSRSLGCTYRGTETVEGYEQFSLTRPLPERYVTDPPSSAGFFSRIFGRKGS